MEPPQRRSAPAHVEVVVVEEADELALVLQAKEAEEARAQHLVVENQEVMVGVSQDAVEVPRFLHPFAVALFVGHIGSKLFHAHVNRCFAPSIVVLLCSVLWALMALEVVEEYGTSADVLVVVPQRGSKQGDNTPSSLGTGTVRDLPR